MDERNDVLIKTLDILERGDFEVSGRCCGSYCFDIFARRRILLLLIKILANIDSISGYRALEMGNISKMLSAAPLLVGNRTRSSEMREGVMYERYGIPAVTPETFEDAVIHETHPVISSTRGGYCVRVDGDALRTVRQERGMSLGEVAENIGVSRRTVSKYEEGERGATFETALRLEEFLDTDVAKPFGIFNVPKEIHTSIQEFGDSLEKAVAERLERLGFEVYPTRKAPFSALTKGEDKEVMITKVVRVGVRRIAQRARTLRSISETVRRSAFFVAHNDSKLEENIEGIPVVRKRELERLEIPEELIGKLEDRMRMC